MSRLPRVTGDAIVAALKRSGFVVHRSVGSHFVLQHSEGRKTVVPLHAGEVIGPGLLTKILRDCRINADQLRELL